MRGIRAWAWVGLGLLALAGCASPEPSAPTAGPTADFTDLELKAGTGRGVVRGVVVDPSIAPVAGVDVSLGDGADAKTAVTDADGRFGFSDVEPGLQFLRASKAGYTPAQSSVDVVADELEPRLTTLMVERVPGSEPYVVAMVWEGFMNCSWTLGGAFATGCLIGAFTDDDSRSYDPIEAEPSFLQSELVWTPTQTLGTNLCMRHYASEDIGGEVLMDDACGESPLVQLADGARLNETGVGTEYGLERLAWVAGYGHEAAPGVALSQRFTMYTHLFYNFEPATGWRFTTDGEPLPPPTG